MNRLVRCDLIPASAQLCFLKTEEEFLAKHEVFGGPHAEVNLFKKAHEAGIKIEGSTVAVTLEPCSHFGKTPPCADLLIKEKIKKVIIGLIDPFEKVAGQGIAKLQAAGIEVEIDVHKDQCEALNREWLFAHKNKRPFVTLKMATSLDGKFFSHSGASQWITGPEARNHAQQLRARVDAMISSWKTVLKMILNSRHAIHLVNCCRLNLIYSLFLAD